MLEIEEIIVILQLGKLVLLFFRIVRFRWIISGLCIAS